MVYGPSFIVNTGIVFSQSWIGVESLSSLQPDKHGGMKTDEDLLNPSLGSAHLEWQLNLIVRAPSGLSRLLTLNMPPL